MNTNRVAEAALIAAIGVPIAHAQQADCSVSGITDARSLVQRLIGDCDGISIPNPCEYPWSCLHSRWKRWELNYRTKL